MPSPHTNSRDAISGRATGVLFFSGFGALWLCTGFSALHLLTIPLLVFSLALPLVALILPAILLLRRLPPAQPAAQDDEQERRAARIFHLVNAAQWGAIFLAVVLCNLLQHPEFIVPAIAAIVGAHLFPLARLFRHFPHYVTGTLLLIWSASTPVAFTRSNMPAAAALGAATILLTSAAFNLISAWHNATPLQEAG